MVTSLEKKYSEFLERRKLAGEILDYRFEAVKLTLVHNIRKMRNGITNTPDFLIIKKDCFEFHETKGRWRLHDKNKIKMASELFPWFKFVAVQSTPEQWIYEYF